MSRYFQLPSSLSLEQKGNLRKDDVIDLQELAELLEGVERLAMPLLLLDGEKLEDPVDVFLGRNVIRPTLNFREDRIRVPRR